MSAIDPLYVASGFGVGLQFFPLNKSGVPASCTTNSQCASSSAGLCLVNLDQALAR